MRLILTIFVVIMVFLTPIYARSIIDARHFLKLGQEAYSQGDFNLAIDSYRRAIVWRSPFNSAAKDAFEKLHELSNDSNLTTEVRLDATRQLRSALYSSRSPLDQIYDSVGEGRSLSEVRKSLDKQILELTPNEQLSVPKFTLEPKSSPTFWQSVGVEIAFFGWVCSMLLLIWRGFDKRGSFNKRVLLPYGTPALGFYLMFLVILGLK